MHEGDGESRVEMSGGGKTDKWQRQHSACMLGTKRMKLGIAETVRSSAVGRTEGG
jgi:hypothetical protein